MRKIAMILIIALSFLQINAQTIVDTTKRWSTVIHRLPSFTIITESIKFEGDTTIDFFDYKKVFRSTDEFQTIWETYGYVRETVDGKVYYRTDSTTEFLLYDFGLAINDIVEVYGICGYGDSYSLSPMTFKVSNIDSVFLGGEYREQFHMNPVFPGDTFPDASEFWIEGIGSKSGILHWEAFLVGGDSYQLLCHSENSTLIYQNSSYTSCYYYWTEISEMESNEKICIYPNPIIDNATIKIENGDPDKEYILEIFDYLGRKVSKQKINKTSVIDRNEFKSGLYIIRIICNGETIKTEKIMME